MEMVRVYNNNTGEILEKEFLSSEEADDYEFILDFLQATYERFHDGNKLY